MPNHSPSLPIPLIQLWLAMLSFALYANTFGHDYTQDDAIVIYDNMYTQQGVSGIGALLSRDTFHGFFKEDGKDKLVKGGRYRPLTPILFAIEYQLFGRSPMASHIMNALLYALLVVVLYRTLLALWYNTGDPAWKYYAVLAATCIFAVHPIHTEAVANIKGRDEIMALLGSLLALRYCLAHFHTKKRRYLLYGGLALFLALMSKENAITFLAVIPVSLYLSRETTARPVLRPGLAMLLPALLFLVIRTSVLGLDFGGESFELMNNPFLKIENGQYVPMTLGEKYATILFTLGLYIKLLVWPHPLTHDYYPRHIEMMSFGDPGVLASCAIYLGLIIVLFISWRRSRIIAWSIFYYFATLSIVSNVVFPIGTNMSERFVFMPSVGFVMVVGYLIYKYVYPSNAKIAHLVTLLIVMPMIAKTVYRNTVWKDDYTLFTTDVHTSTRSAKVLNAAGGAMSTRAANMPDGPQRTKLLDQSAEYLSKSLEIHPNYSNPALLLGNVNYYREDYDEAIEAYMRAMRLNPGADDAASNLAITYRDAGRAAGEKEQNLTKAMKYLKQSYSLNPDDMETVRLLGVASGVAGNHEAAAKYFEQVYKAQPDNQNIIKNLFQAHMSAGNVERAAELQGLLQ